MPPELAAHGFLELWHPGVLAFVLALVAAYLWVTGPGRGAFPATAPVPLRQRIAFVTGLSAIYVAEGTPLHLLSEQYLFSAHMVQHFLLTLVMGPLLLVGTPPWLARAALKWRPLFRFWRGCTHPVMAVVLFNLIYSIWHFPVFYDKALWVHDVHMVQHALLVPTALMMWWPLLSPHPDLPPVHPLGQLGYISFATIAQIVVFAAVTFAEDPLYSRYVAYSPRLGVDPMADQQLAGVIMKMSGMITFTLALGIVFFRWAAQEMRPRRQVTVK